MKILENIEMKICVTGHRPNKMYGYDICNKQWTELKEKFKKLLVENKCDEAITGMALVPCKV